MKTNASANTNASKFVFHIQAHCIGSCDGGNIFLFGCEYLLTECISEQ